MSPWLVLHILLYIYIYVCVCVHVYVYVYPLEGSLFSWKIIGNSHNHRLDKFFIALRPPRVWNEFPVGTRFKTVKNRTEKADPPRGYTCTCTCTCTHVHVHIHVHTSSCIWFNYFSYTVWWTRIRTRAHMQACLSGSASPTCVLKTTWAALVYTMYRFSPR